ncbi:MAG: type II toxin-antitoxin system PemK/MazF family toxin [Candidatus Woesearchaeota archaeon]
MMRVGIMLRSGDVVLARVHFTDTFEIKTRPCLVLYEEFDNIVIAGITSNLRMEGIPLSKEDGADRNCVIKLNYIFTIHRSMATMRLFHLNKKKKEIVYKKLNDYLKKLVE